MGDPVLAALISEGDEILAEATAPAKSLQELFLDVLPGTPCASSSGRRGSIVIICRASNIGVRP